MLERTIDSTRRCGYVQIVRIIFQFARLELIIPFLFHSYSASVGITVAARIPFSPIRRTGHIVDATGPLSISACSNQSAMIVASFV
jgi:hypothetical protein